MRVILFLCTTYCRIIKNKSYIKGLIKGAISNIVIIESDNLRDEIELFISELDNIEMDDLQLLNEIKVLKTEIQNLQLELAEEEPCGDNCVAYVTGMTIICNGYFRAQLFLTVLKRLI